MVESQNNKREVKNTLPPENIDPEKYYAEFANSCHKIIKDKDCSKYFKRYDQKELPRVNKIVGMLKGISPKSVLDVGSGRGRLLFPMMYNLANTLFDVVEPNAWRYEVLKAVSDGGIGRLCVWNEDITEFKHQETYEVVVASEVLEHIPNIQKAITNILRYAEKHIIISVPSKRDNNPDHIHFLMKHSFINMFFEAMAELKTKSVVLNFSYTDKELIIHGKI